MRRLLFIIFLTMARSAYAGCPLLVHEDAAIEREFENVCQAVSVASSLSQSSGTVSNLTVSTLTVNSMAFISTLTWTTESGSFAAERCGREVQFTTTASSSTASGNFVPTNLSGSVTIHSVTSYVKIRANGDSTNTAASTPVSFSLTRNGTDLSTGSGFVKISGSGTSLVAIPPFYIDSPATTGVVAYALTMRTNGGTMTFCGNSLTCVLTLQECL